MAHPLCWPGKYFFYPIGNTPAVCLTRDLPLEEPAKILLLGCGDPRNVLYTISCEPLENGRSLDFTCCDIDPAILARNVILLTMVADQQPMETVWNVFFHLYLDKLSHSAFIDHCQKLINHSDTLHSWNASSYGPSIKMCTEYTLHELRRHWSLYVDMPNLPPQRIKAIRDAFNKQSKSSANMYGSVLTSARSSGPLVIQAAQISSEQFKNYWTTGVTFTDRKLVATANILNATFAYSLQGEGCNVHYGSDPLTPFHLAALFGNAKRPLAVADLVKAAQAEFIDWCSAYKAAISSTTSSAPIIRFVVGEATVICRALRSFATTRTLNLSIPVSQWKTQTIQLSPDEYVSQPDGAPATFNVIETSNLHDHIGLLNVLIAALPLLSTSSLSSVLYTESLLFRGQDATKEFSEHLYADITTVALLLGLCPVDYLSGYTTRSNTHELTMYTVIAKGKDANQFHQVTTWKSPTSSNALTIPDRAAFRPPAFDSHQLGTLLYDIYHKLFEQEDSMHFLRLNQQNLLKAVSSSNLIHYMRESFVLFLKLVRERLGISAEQWMDVMDRIFNLEDADQTLPMDTVNYNDLCAQLYRHGVYKVPYYNTELPRIGRFVRWDSVPPVVRIIFAVPRDHLAALEDTLNQAGTPLLQCDVRGNWSHNTFTSIHVAFGAVVPMGTSTQPRVILNEDAAGWKGTSSLIVSFAMPAQLLTLIEPPDNLNVCLSVRSTPATVALIPKLGMSLCLFSAKLMNTSLVHVLPEPPLPYREPTVPPPSPALSATDRSLRIGQPGAVLVELDEECEFVTSLTARIPIENEEVKRLFRSQSTPQVMQVSSCIMRVTIDGHIEDVIYPFPIVGSRNKLRLARKSLYIEVVVPVSGPFKNDGVKLNPFAVNKTGGLLNPWSIHRLNLARLPILDIKAPQIDRWLNPHIGSMLSARERSMRKKHDHTDTLVLVKDTLHSIFVRSSGIQGGASQRVFALRDVATNNRDTVFFVSDLRYDLHSHTMVCDAYVLPLTEELMLRIWNSFSALVQRGNMMDVTVYGSEMKAWKQLLPAFVERCRSSWTHGANCEYKSRNKIPLAEIMEADPLCSCGRGKDVEGMAKVALWGELTPYVTRVALSPLFAVSYLETIGRDPSAHKCYSCRGKGKPKIKTCKICKKVRYCSEECQKKDWKSHKRVCKPSA